MDRARIRGVGFGSTSGVITTLGLMVGMYFTVSSKLAVIGSIFVIAISDAMSDALGIHVSTEAEGKSKKVVWKATFYTLVSKFFTALIFAVPVLILSLEVAIFANVLIGLIIIGTMSYFIAKSNEESCFRTILEHLAISVLVIFLSALIGHVVSIYFG